MPFSSARFAITVPRCAARNMRFTALVVVGDSNGHVGAGLGKATEIPEAIRKGKEDAIKKLISVKLDDNNSISAYMWLLLLNTAKRGRSAVPEKRLRILLCFFIQ